MIYQRDIERWLGEDIGHHDVTNAVSGDGIGRLVAVEGGICAGLEAGCAVFEYFDLDVEAIVENGETLSEGDEILRVEGSNRDVLRAERTSVNVIAHASGIATKTRRIVDRAHEVNPDVRIAGTRKTTPGLRGVEKRAVDIGGGDTHRLDLSHMVLIKDNHIAVSGLEEAIERARERASFSTRIEVEVERRSDALLAADAGADCLLLDNMTPTEIQRTVAALENAGFESVLTEASGGITIETVTEFADTGVDVISMGALTHSAPSLDLSFRLA